jgi:hypothetical protein
MLVTGPLFEAGQIFPSGVFASAELGSIGDAGTIRLTVDQLHLRDGGVISGNTFGQGDGGALMIAAGSMMADGTVEFAERTVTAGISALADPRARGGAGTIEVVAGSLCLQAGAAISSRSGTDQPAGAVQIIAAGAVDVNGGTIETNSTSSGPAGDVAIQAEVLRLRDGGLVGSSGTDTGRAGDIGVRVARLEAQDGSIRTSGAGAEGGRVDAVGSDQIYLRRSEFTSNGIEPAAGASVITLRAPEIILNASRVESLTGTGEPLPSSGEALLLGELTVISADSLVAGSSTVQIEGLQTNLGSDLQLAPAGFLDVSRLLRESCAATGGAPRSTFTRGGRGGLPPGPDRPLPSAGVETLEPEHLAAVGTVFLDGCAGSLVPETNS